MKTQKSFRKKALLSSVSMLLVSTVAVGSATFAWFTQNPNATAQGLVLKATAANGLQVISETQKNDSQAWSHDAILNWDATGDKASTTPVVLDAASFVLTAAPLPVTAANVEAAEDTASTAKEGADISTTTGFYREKVYARLTGSGTEDIVQLDGVNVTWVDDAAVINPAIRVAVTYHDNSGAGTDTLLGVWKQTEGAMKYVKSGETKYAALTSTASYDAKAFAPDFGSTATIDAGNVHPNGEDYFEVIVYLDGEDSACKTNNVNASNIISEVDLKLNLKPTTP